jgi:hypothetical protein
LSVTVATLTEEEAVGDYEGAQRGSGASKEQHTAKRMSKIDGAYLYAVLRPTLKQLPVDLVGYDVDLILLKCQSNVGGSIPPLGRKIFLLLLFSSHMNACYPSDDSTTRHSTGCRTLPLLPLLKGCCSGNPLLR